VSDQIPSAKALSAINLLLRRFLATAWRCFEFEKRQRNGETLPTDFPSVGWQSNPYMALAQASEDVLNRSVTGPLWEFLSPVLLEWKELYRMEV
jgi:hypothetical protein